MSTQYYNTIPPVAKTYAALCLLTTCAYELELYNIEYIALIYSDVFKKVQVWKLITSFFFLESFSLPFTTLYGVQLEKGPFDKRTADILWVYIFGAISLLLGNPYFWSSFHGPSLIYVLVYVWSREFPNARIFIHNPFELKGFYIPWFMLVIDLVVGNPLKPSLVGIGTGHLLSYFISGGSNILKTSTWVHTWISFVFNGRSNRLNADRTTGARSQPDDAEPPISSGGVAFRGPLTQISWHY